MERVVRGVIASVLLATLGAFALSIAELSTAVGQPFAGFVFLANGDVGPRLMTAPLAGPEVGELRPQDRVVAVDGTPVATGAEALARIQHAPVGTPIRYTLQRSGGERFELTVATVPFGWQDAARLFGPFLLGGVLLLVLTGLVAALRPGDPNALALFALGTALGTVFGTLMVDGLLGYRLGPDPQLIGLALVKASVFHMALLWPVRRWPLTRWPRGVPALAYATMLLHALVFRFFYYDAPRVTTVMAHVSVATFVAVLVLLVVNVARVAWSSSDVANQRAARVVLAGPAVGVLFGILLFANTWIFTSWSLPPVLLLLPVWITIGAISYAIVRHNMFELDAVARRMLSLGIQGVAAAAAYLFTLSLVEGFTGGAAGWTAATVFAAALLVAIPAAGPLRRRAEAVAASLFPQQRRATAAMHRASRELARLRDVNEIARTLRETIEESTHASVVRVLVGQRGEPLAERGNERDAIAPRAPDSALAAGMSFGAIADLERAPAAVSRGLRSELEALGAVLFIPLPAERGVVGAFLLGKRGDGRPYTSEDWKLLETLAAQSAVAFENARAWEEVCALEERLSRENVYLREQLELQHDFRDVIGQSEEIRSALAQIERVAPTDATVLVIGETGTGKELAIRALHALSSRRERILVKIPCAAIPESLIESELFGHERGSFTGATQTKPGRFEVADHGTLFFDDVDTLPLGVQAKLLRAIQEGEVQRVGSNVVRTVDVRIVAATNKDLLSEVRAGRFREDLYYRLHVIPIRLPPLRERPGDIPLLVQHFAQSEGAKLGRRITAVAAEAMAELTEYAWPGNVRELRNVIERALVMTSGEVLRLPGPLRGAGVASRESRGELGTLSFAELLRNKKIEWIREALARSGGNQRRAAELLGLHRPSLTRMIRELGIRDAGGAGDGAAPAPSPRAASAAVRGPGDD